MLKVRPLNAVSAVVAVLVLAVVATMAILTNGYPTRKLDLNDAGIWVTNEAQLTFGRVNKSAMGLDAWLDAPGGGAKRELDVFQDASAVVQFDRATSALIPINTTTVTNANDQTRALAADAQVDMRGGTIAAVDPRTGKVWATTYDARGGRMSLQQLDPEADPIVEIGAAPDGSAHPAAISVATNGSVLAALANGKYVVLPAADGGFGKPELGQIPTSLKGVQVAWVGTRHVFYDAEQGLVVLPDGKTKQVDADPAGVLQSAGDDATGVLIASSKGLVRVTFEDGVLHKVSDIAGRPAQPVRVSGCDFGAWAGGSGGVVRDCGTPEELTGVKDSGALVRPAFRVNRGQVVLNDSSDGRTFDLATQNRLDQWDQIKPKSNSDNQNPDQQVRPNRNEAKPVAHPDTVGVRPGGTAMGYLLDNDTDALGQVLMITDISGVPDGASVVVAADGQSVAIRPADGGGGFTFNYSISNGANSSSASVTVNVVPVDAPNRAPRLREGFEEQTYTVASFGTLPISVLGNWRDDDGDAVSVVSADVDGQIVPVTPEGRIEFTAGRETSRVTRTLSYKVTDGSAKVVEQKVPITVLEAASLVGTPPITKPDSVRGEVGRTITFNPLDNDIPGSDPRSPDARLRLGSPLKPVPGLDIKTDVTSGLVTVKAASPGSYDLSYSAAFGSSAMQAGAIRLDVVAASERQTPIAMPDQGTVRGNTGVRIDPLANDSDPLGGILTVTALSYDKVNLDAAIIGGRWILVTSKQDATITSSHSLTYTVSNGAQSAQGHVTVTQLPALPDAQPIAKDDLAIVRVGDTALVNVLNNDVSANGEQLTLVTNLNDGLEVGELKVLDPASSSSDPAVVGRAFVTADKVRYVAPATVDAEKQVTIEYYAQTPTGKRSMTGKVHVTITPLPADADSNRAPTPDAIDVRVNAGQRLKVSIPPTSQDPDGDSVTVLGLGSAPALGRVVGQSPTSITYEAYPNVETFGTDTFSLIVADRFGKSAPALVRVGVTPPGEAQPPVAVNDSVTAEPGALVRVDALANDLFSRAEHVELVPLDSMNDQLPADVKAEGPKGPISIQAPGKDAQPVIVSYALKGNGGVGSTGSIKVVSSPGYRNAPVVFDEVAKAEGSVATADVLARAWDPDGKDDALKVTMLGGPAETKLAGGKVTVPLTPQPQVIPFQVTDESGATSAAVVFVPSAGSAAPHLIPDGMISMDADSTVTLSLRDYVVSPRERAVQFTSDSVFAASPAGKIEVEPVGTTSFKVTSKDGYVGPAAVTFRVMDGTSLTEEGVLSAMVSVPVQVGPNTPVLRCPETTLELVAGGQDRTLDIASWCRVWAPNPAAIDDMVFTAEWQGDAARDVQAENGHIVTFRAGGSAVPDARGTLLIGVQGSPAVKRPVNIVVRPAAAPTMASQSFNDILQGTPVRVPLGIKSPLRDAKPNIVSVRKVSGPDAAVNEEGTTLTITPGGESHGTLVYEVVASDVPDKARTDRQVVATITLVVYGVPDAPSPPTPGQELRSHEASLVWQAPPDNGAPITGWIVTSSLGKTYTNCNTNSCTITGLTNDVPVKFQVQAVNKAGPGKPSGWSSEVTPDEPPHAPTALAVSNPLDRLLTLSWTAAVVDGSKVHTYHIIVNGTAYTAAGSATSAQVAMPENNNAYEIKLIAENKAGTSPDASIVGQSAGQPIGLQAPSFEPATLVGASTAVVLRWSAVDKNGPTDLTYRVVRDGTKEICSGVLATTCTDDTVAYDGAQRSYVLTATNGAGGPQHSSSVTGSWAAIGTPERGAAPTTVATGVDRQVRVTGNVPDSRGAQSRVEILVNGSVNRTLNGLPPRGSQFNELITVPANGQAASVAFRVCNEVRCGTASPGSSVVAFGPIQSLSITNAGVSGQNVSYRVSVNPNGKPVTVYVNGAAVGTTGVGTWNTTVTENIGWSTTKTYSATASDGSRNAGPTSVSITSGAPPPNPSVTVSRGPIHTIADQCTAWWCAELIVQTKDFPTASVSCRISDSDLFGAWGKSWTQGGNETLTLGGNPLRVYGGHSISVTCDGITGTNANWKP